MVNNTGAIVNSGGSTGVATISGNIGASVLSVTESSTTSRLVLSGLNASTGGLYVSMGTVQAGSAYGLGAGTVTLGTAASNGVLDLGGQSPNVVALASGSFSPAGDIIGNSSTSTNAVLYYTGPASSTFGGVIRNTVGSGGRTTAVTMNSFDGHPAAYRVEHLHRRHDRQLRHAGNHQSQWPGQQHRQHAITLSGGFLALCNDNSVTFSPSSGTAGYNVTVNGSPVIDVNSTSGTATGETLTLGNLAIGGNNLSFTNGNGYSLSMGTVTASAGPTLTNLMTSGTVSLAALTVTRPVPRPRSSTAPTLPRSPRSGSSARTGTMPWG